MNYQDATDAIWTKWPKRSEMSLYECGGGYTMRSRSRKFDLSDQIAHHFDGSLKILFGIRCRGKTEGIWTEESLCVQESNIRYDLTFDVLQVWIERVKGLDLSCREEALWLLHIEDA